MVTLGAANVALTAWLAENETRPAVQSEEVRISASQNGAALRQLLAFQKHGRHTQLIEEERARCRGRRRANEGCGGVLGGGQVDVDEAFVAVDSLGAQALAAAADDAALEDALYALDQAVESGAMLAEAYLKQV